MGRYRITVWDEQDVSYRLYVEADNGIAAGSDAWRWLDRKYGLRGNTTVQFDEPEGRPRPGDLRRGRFRRRLQPPDVEVGRLPRASVEQATGEAAVGELEDRLGLSLPADYRAALASLDETAHVADAALLQPREVYWLDLEDPDRYLAFAVTLGGDVLAFDVKRGWSVTEMTHDPLGAAVLAESFADWRRTASN